MKSLVGALLKVPELNIPTIGGGDGMSIASMLEMWVSGKTLREIADRHFADVPDIQRRLTECCRMVYQTLTHQGSWGIGSLQSMSELAEANLSEEAKAAIRSVPIHDLLWRSHRRGSSHANPGCTPDRSAWRWAKGLRLKRKEAEPAPRLQKARAWLQRSSAETWQEIASRIQPAYGRKTDAGCVAHHHRQCQPL